MYKIYHLENTEVNIVDRLIEAYRLPLELICGPDEGATWDSDYIYNIDTDENLWLEDGIDYILEAINNDDREVFQSKLDDWEQVEFLRLAAELGVTTETIWKGKDLRQNMPKWQKRIELPLEGFGKNGEFYKIVAERVNTMPDHDEVDIVIEDQDGTVIQDVVRVEQTVKNTNQNATTHINKTMTVKVYKDEYDEDYTDVFHIKVYDDAEETTNN